MQGMLLKNCTKQVIHYYFSSLIIFYKFLIYFFFYFIQIVWMFLPSNGWLNLDFTGTEILMIVLFDKLILILFMAMNILVTLVD
jgi:hypothetical protein